MAVLLTAAALAIQAGSAGGSVSCDRYASPTGDDGAAGTLAEPYRSVDHLVHSVAVGETGCLLGYPEGTPPTAAGLYEEDLVTIDVPGITLRSADGQVAQVKGELRITADDVTVSHLVLDGRNSGGDPSPRITGSDVVLAHNNVTTRSTADCVNVTGSAERVSILHNRIHDCRRGARIEHGTFVVVSDNAVYDNSGPGVLLSPAAGTSVVSRNIVDANGSGIVWGSGALGRPLSNVATGNVVSNSDGLNVTADWEDPDGGGPAEPQPGLVNAFFRNCVHDAGQLHGGIDQSVTSSGWNPEKIWRPQNEVADPLYADAAQGDFTLGQASRCRAVGDLSLAVEDDGPGSDDSRPSEAEAVNLRPNVLVIMTDDQRADDTVIDGVMPHTLDWFKRGTPSGAPGGMQFSQGFSTTPLCCPARASFMTGQYVHNHGVNENAVAPPPSLDPDNPTYQIQPHTIQHYLRDRAGYRTGLFGKFLNSWRFSAAVIAPNFDDFGYFQGERYCQFEVMEDPGVRRTLGNPPATDPLRCVVNTPEDYSTDWITQEGVRFIQEAEQGSDEQPWLLYLTPTVPHDDNPTGEPVPKEQYAAAPVPSESDLLNSAGFQEGLRAPGDQLTDKPPSVQAERPPCDPGQTLAECDAAWTQKVVLKRARQLRALMSVDDMVQSVFAKLQETGEDDDTLAFFVSDHGYHWGEHGLLTKARPYLEGLKIPFFVRWPDNPAVAQGATDSTRMVANVDVAPTVLDAVDVAPDHVLDGRSLIDPTMTRSRMLIEFWHGGDLDWTSLATPSYQYTEFFSAPDTGFREYYRFPSDLSQVTNLFGDGDPTDPPATETDPIAAALQADYACVGASCP